MFMLAERFCPAGTGAGAGGYLCQPDQRFVTESHGPSHRELGDIRLGAARRSSVSSLRSADRLVCRCLIRTQIGLIALYRAGSGFLDLFTAEGVLNGSGYLCSVLRVVFGEVTPGFILRHARGA
jgi:hypothetical protein